MIPAGFVSWMSVDEKKNYLLPDRYYYCGMATMIQTHTDMAMTLTQTPC